MLQNANISIVKGDRGPAMGGSGKVRHDMTIGKTTHPRTFRPSPTPRQPVLWPRAFGTVLSRVAAMLGASAKGHEKPQAEAAQALDPSGPEAREDAQLTRLSGVIERASLHGERAQRCHDGAGLRIDAALYELEQLREELRAVVDPALLAGFQRRGVGNCAPDTSGTSVASTTPDRATAGPAKAARTAA
ncbi:MAG: hypothetical protein ABL907_05055 [Hyphomicrobium sp.]